MPSGSVSPVDPLARCPVPVACRTVARSSSRDVGEGGHQQERQGGVVLADPAQHLEARHAGHAHVGDHHRRLALRQQAEGGDARFRGGDGKSLSGQKSLQQAALAGVVIHHQDARR
jgi:hypothetical protein